MRTQTLSKDLTLLVGTVRIRHLDVFNAPEPNAVGEFGHGDVDVVMEENTLNDAIKGAVGAEGKLTVGKRDDGGVDIVRRFD